MKHGLHNFCLSTCLLTHYRLNELPTLYKWKILILILCTCMYVSWGWLGEATVMYLASPGCPAEIGSELGGCPSEIGSELGLLSLQQESVEGKCSVLSFIFSPAPQLFYFTFIHFPLSPLHLSFSPSTISSISLLPFSGRLGVVGSGNGVVYLTSPGRPTEIGLQLGKACYPCSR